MTGGPLGAARHPAARETTASARFAIRAMPRTYSKAWRRAAARARSCRLAGPARRYRPRMKRAWILLLLVACGGGGGAHEMPADAPPAPVYAPQPQIIDRGGPVLAPPHVQPIFFTGDTAMQQQIEQFLGQLASSPYWTATTSEYGIAPLTVSSTIVVSDPPPATLDELTALVTSHLDGAHAGWPAADSSTVYVVVMPPGSVLQTPNGDACLLGSAHDELQGPQGEPIAVAIVPRCTLDGSQQDWLTVSIAHEVIEAVTDPRVRTAPAFGDVDADHYVWARTMGNEVVDLCESLVSANQPLVGSFVVPRSWSNAAARAGQDPCVPALARPYVAATVAPSALGSVPIAGYTGQVTTRGIEIPVGATRTVEIDLTGETTTDPVIVGATDFASTYRGGSPELTFVWDRQYGKAGDKLHVAITHVRGGAMQGSAFVLMTSANGQDIASWVGFVAN